MTDRTHWEGCWRDPAHHACALARINDMEAERDKAYANLARLRSVLETEASSTHTQHCTESWTDRGLHAPGCLMYELEPEE